MVLKGVFEDKMPTYEYECEGFGKVFEKFQMMREERLKDFPYCGGSVKRLIRAGMGVIYKGVEKLLYFLEKFWHKETKDLEEGFQEGMEKVYFDSIEEDQSKLEGKNSIECLSLLMDFVRYLIEKLKFGNLSGFELEVNDVRR